jgi:hypothetical protein
MITAMVSMRSCSMRESRQGFGQRQLVFGELEANDLDSIAKSSWWRNLTKRKGAEFAEKIMKFF